MSNTEQTHTCNHVAPRTAAEKSDCCISLKNVCKTFGPKKILQDINLCAMRGSIYGLLGPSGCGKTTTVKIIAGISEATSGTAEVLGERMPKLSLMNKVGYMAQSDALYTSLTAIENLRFFASLYGMTTKQSTARIAQVMALVNLSDELNKPISAFSGGMKRRLSLAMSLIHLPQVLILDEPTVGIDPLLRRTIWEELYRLAESGITILVTTHVMDEAEKCHELAMMRDGCIIARGTPSELIKMADCKNIEEAFIFYGSSPAENGRRALTDTSGSEKAEVLQNEG